MLIIRFVVIRDGFMVWNVGSESKLAAVDERCLLLQTRRGLSKQGFDLACMTTTPNFRSLAIDNDAGGSAHFYVERGGDGVKKSVCVHGGVWGVGCGVG